MKDLEEFDFPADLGFTEDHVWISKKAPYRVGISDYAQYRIRGLNFIELPESGHSISKGAVCGNLESRKRVHPLHCPVDGRITAVNQDIVELPRLIKDEPYGRGWIFEIEPGQPAQLARLMDNVAYRAYLAKLALP